MTIENKISKLLSSFPHVQLMTQVTPIEKLRSISKLLNINLLIKRDDMSGLGFGGNKIRQLEFYIGEAVRNKADTILITGAVQSNFVRATAAVAAKYGMKSIIQLEERVPDMSDQYYESGNILLSKILEAEFMSYPEGEDEIGADRALHDKANELRKRGRNPYIINLGISHPPIGAFGYMLCAEEIFKQNIELDMIVVASGSGLTHAGLIAGARLLKYDIPIHGICVRRNQTLQEARIATVLDKIEDLISKKINHTLDDINVWDTALSPGYGQISEKTLNALNLMARKEGVFLDPVYTAKTFSGLLDLVDQGIIRKNQTVLMMHTGGLPAIFGYEQKILLQ